MLHANELQVASTSKDPSTHRNMSSLVSSERQLADGLTMVSARQLLAERLQQHSYRLVYDASFTATPWKDTEARRRSEESINEPQCVITESFCPIFVNATTVSDAVSTDDRKVR